ncbi:S-adenosyl-L-methionine-dependent methyltransferase [Hyaloraphidium curvatum]|nr:S-adenosyl-L-methionine-dependent methyltransferase [Hyaloraphidium curvatum]
MLGHALTFVLAVLVLPLLRAVGLRSLAESLSARFAPQRKGLKGHQAALEEFYAAQAGSYDATRGVLLKGREEMLERAVAAVLHRRDSGEGRTTTWIDLGGGTGYNVEAMAAALERVRPGLHLADVFEKVYLVDLTPSLCDVARERFAKLGWDNVEVVCGDATVWRPDGWDGQGRAGLVTFSYSLSMMPSPFPAVDHALSLLRPHGTLAVVDFYTSHLAAPTGHPDPLRRTSWAARSFWTSWFAFDGIHLAPERRLYLEHRLPPSFSRSYRNDWMSLGFVRIPYYVYLSSLPEAPLPPAAVQEQQAGRAEGRRRARKGSAASTGSAGSVGSAKSAEFVVGGI